MVEQTKRRVVMPWQAPHVGLTEDDAPNTWEWTGYLTLQNGEQVGQRIAEQFTGRWLVVTSAHEYRGWEPEVTAPVRFDFRGQEAVSREVDEQFAYVGFGCGAYHYGFHSYMHEQPPFRLDPPTGTDRPREVLAWINEAAERPATPWLHFTDRTLIIKNRAPNGQGYWLRFDLLENMATRHVVLEPEETATVYETLERASGDPAQDGLIEARCEVLAHIDRAWNDNNDGERVKRWLPTHH